MSCPHLCWHNSSGLVNQFNCFYWSIILMLTLLWSINHLCLDPRFPNLVLLFSSWIRWNKKPKVWPQRPQQKQLLRLKKELHRRKPRSRTQHLFLFAESVSRWKKNAIAKQSTLHYLWNMFLVIWCYMPIEIDRNRHFFCFRLRDAPMWTVWFTQRDGHGMWRTAPASMSQLKIGWWSEKIYERTNKIQ